jgi:hypothetical protein
MSQKIIRRGYARRDELLDKVEKLRIPNCLILQDRIERNRALKFGRQKGWLLVSRTWKGSIRLWRLA